MPPGQSGVLRLFGVGCAVSFLEITVHGEIIDLAQGGSYTLDIPLPDIDIYANISGASLVANTPLAHIITSIANKKTEEQLHTLLAADPTNVYRFLLTRDVNNIPILRMFVSTNAVAGLVIPFVHIWDIWITNCSPFHYLAEGGAPE